MQDKFRSSSLPVKKENVTQLAASSIATDTRSQLSGGHRVPPVELQTAGITWADAAPPPQDKN